VSTQKPPFRHIAIALAMLAFIFLVSGWNLPIAISGCPNDNLSQHVPKECKNNTVHTLGFVLGTFVTDTWDYVTRKESLDGFLVIFTGLLATFTYLLFGATRGLLRHTPQIERAYISGGGIPVMEVAGYASTSGPTLPGSSGGSTTYIPIPKPTGQFELHINNHGKTPGELTQIGIGFCDAFAVPPTPDYTLLYFQEWIGPGVQSWPLHRIPIPANFSSPAIFGRFYYRDILVTDTRPVSSWR
jgi:hypothetical protein